MLRFILILSFVAASLTACNFTMEPDPGFTGDGPTAIYDAFAMREAADLGVGLGGEMQMGGAADIAPVPPEAVPDAAASPPPCHDAGVPRDGSMGDGGVGDGGLHDGSAADAGPTCDMAIDCSDAGVDDGGACVRANDGGVDGG